MSFLITELVEDVQFLEENTKDGKKATYITGPFMEAGVKNRNGRIYPISVMSEELNRYKSSVVSQNRAYGELNHPTGATINLERACILIKELNLQPNGQVLGKARVTETPTGNIVKGLLESGANLGVSSRALGSVRENKEGIMEVQKDFRIITASDVVADPSAPNAFVNGIMENVEYFYNESTGEFFEQCKKKINRRKFTAGSPSKQIEEEYYNFFNKILTTL